VRGGGPYDDVAPLLVEAFLGGRDLVDVLRQADLDHGAHRHAPVLDRSSDLEPLDRLVEVGLDHDSPLPKETTEDDDPREQVPRPHEGSNRVLSIQSCGARRGSTAAEEALNGVGRIAAAHEPGADPFAGIERRHPIRDRAELGSCAYPRA
jgi:hypothetical protein